MAKVTVVRALKYKNRLVERMRKLEDDIRTFNSVLKGGERDVDVLVAMKERMALEQQIVNLKLLMDDVNKPIKESIARLQELKGRISFLQSIGTAHGIQDSRRTLYGEQGTVEYEAAIRKNDVDGWIATAQEEIDNIQEGIDLFNNTNKIEIQMSLK